MREKILTVVNEMKFASADEISSILDNVNASSLKKELESLEQERVLFRVLPNEISVALDGFIAGPNFELEKDVEIQKLLIDKGLSSRSLSVINWELFSKRKLSELQNDLNGLLDDIVKKNEEPKKLELRYFELSIRYHELNRILYEKCETELLNTVNKSLEKGRSYLDSLEY